MTAPARRLSIWLIALIAGRSGSWRASSRRNPAPARVPCRPAPDTSSLRIAGDSSPVSLANFKNGFSSVIDPALPAVVNISSTKVVKQQVVPNPFFNDPFFRQFFGNQFGHSSSSPRRSARRAWDRVSSSARTATS